VTLADLREALRERGGTIAEALGPADEGLGRADEVLAPPPGPPQLAARGPRTAGAEREYELLLEMILEGSLLHYGAPRVVRCEDPDLALLLGDQLYALGLSRLAQLDDLDAVAELADLISLLAQAQASSDPELAQAVWEAGAAAIGWGSGSEHEAAKALARVGAAEAREALLDAAQKALQAPPEGLVS
jgi:hypothetical protein